MKLELYEKVRKVPKEALKEITAGRLKGKSDINPMWRIKKLTEEFGPCGIGWKTEITKQWLEPGVNGEIAAFCNINLYIQVDGKWSDPIPGTGGSMFVANERNGPYVSDECYKMAYTDAISVACKALGFAADVYWSQDSTKYDARQKEAPQPAQSPVIDAVKVKVFADMVMETKSDIDGLMAFINQKFGRNVLKIEDLTEAEWTYGIKAMEKKKGGAK